MAARKIAFSCSLKNLNAVTSQKPLCSIIFERGMAAHSLNAAQKLRSILDKYSETNFPHEFPRRVREQIVKDTDLDKDGYIDREELRQLLKNIGAELRPTDLSALIDLGDIDGTGKIRADKFLKLLDKH
eukprot:CAMPEP_0117741986 /NCGR_PEP_ID=MMETSP0947-20121206/5264_1 /TAXON_ID=44440 /ORGANISM="Chattonella subsalsa, Strain CCMP2191" /LENGTH=128 /DNA_ID=CAMNT_0005558397 /DNA_START=110 /DNA_END=496 /DNA_ORIENTATION=-